MEPIYVIGLILTSAFLGYVACKIRDSSLCLGTLHIERDHEEQNLTHLYLELKANPKFLEGKDFVMFRIKTRK